MKKIYQEPTMIVVRLQHHGIICSSDPTGPQNYDEVSSNIQYTRESTSIWDNEW